MSATEANPAVVKASRWYPAEDTPQRKKVSVSTCDGDEMLVKMMAPSDGYASKPVDI
jgi:hypothetical protein